MTAQRQLEPRARHPAELDHEHADRFAVFETALDPQRLRQLLHREQPVFHQDLTDAAASG